MKTAVRRKPISQENALNTENASGEQTTMQSSATPATTESARKRTAKKHRQSKSPRKRHLSGPSPGVSSGMPGHTDVSLNIPIDVASYLNKAVAGMSHFSPQQQRQILTRFASAL